IAAAARQRQVAGGSLKSEAPAKLAEADRGETRDKVSTITGIKRSTLAKAEAIVEAAEAEPEKDGKLLEDMDRTGRVDGPHKRLKNAQAAEAIRRDPPGLPMHGPYRAGIVDPPWASEPDEDRDHGGRGYYPYSTMTPEQVAAMPVPAILAPDASVWLWV